jgi:dCMP deaminase
MCQTRPSEHEVSMDYARNAARRGTCSRLQVGAVITVSGRLISSGYNGAPSKLDHCDHTCDCGYPGTEGGVFWKRHLSDCASEKPCRVSVHAEANAIAFAARYGVSTQGSTMFVTHSPCLDCAKLIINAGISKVVYGESYRDDSGWKLLQAADVEVVVRLV